MRVEAALELLKDLGAQNVRQRAKTKDGTVEIHCDCLSEITGHVQKDGNSASFNADKEVYKCFSCGAGFNLPQLLLYSGLALHWGEAIEKAGQYTSITPDKWEFVEWEIEYGAKDKHRLPEVDAASALAYRNKGHTYLTLPLEEGGRGIPAKIWRELGVHYHEPSKCIRFPVMDHRGRLVGWVDRAFPDSPLYDPENKYLNSTGLEKSEVLYGYLHAERAMRGMDNPYLIVCEGPGDLARWHYLGYYNVVATLGCDPSDFQVWLMSQLCDTTLISGYDNPLFDKNVWRGTHKLIEKARPYFQTTKIGWYPDGHKDPGTFNAVHAEMFIANAKTPLELRLAKLRSDS